MEDRVSVPRLAGRHRATLAALGAILAVTLAWWALALWPLSDAAPPALLRARLICFGTAENGLPSGVGWMMLTGEPIMITLLLLAVAGGTTVREALEGVARHALGRYALGMTALGLVAALSLAGARVTYALGFRGPGPSEFGAAVASASRIDRPAPPLDLVDQHGRVVTLAALRGRPTLVTFAYAHCQTVCPLVVQNVARARDRLVARGTAPQLIVITLDPWRDTPARLAAIARQWALPEDARVLSGSVAEVEATLDRWGVVRSRDLHNGEITHPQVVYVVDGSGRIAFVSTGDADVITELVHRL